MNRSPNHVMANEIANVLGAAEMLCGPGADAEVVILKVLNKADQGILDIPREPEAATAPFKIVLSLPKRISTARGILTYKEIAEAMGVGVGSVRMWESGISLPEEHIQKILIDEITLRVLRREFENYPKDSVAAHRGLLCDKPGCTIGETHIHYPGSNGVYYKMPDKIKK